MAASMHLDMISPELCVQSLGATISILLDRNHEWKPEINLFYLVGWGELQFSRICTDRRPDN
jgi:hypothetical protein